MVQTSDGASRRTLSCACGASEGLQLENMIRNCAVTFRRVCPQTWEGLRSTEEATIRFCDSCQREVFLCAADDEAVQHAKQGHCIAKPMPSRTNLRPVVLGRPETPPRPPTTDEAALEEQYLREAGKTQALRDVEYASRVCPQCGYPCADWLTTCKVCGYHIGRFSTG